MNKFTWQFLIPVLVVLIIPWTWISFKKDFLITFISVLLTICLFLAWHLKVSGKTQNIRKITLAICLVLFGLVSAVLITKNFDPSLKLKNPTETSMFYRQHGFLADGLGPFFTNKFSLYYYTNYYYPLSNYIRNVFYATDPNLYFFSSHPREKSGIDEFEKYYSLLIPFFLIGLFYFATLLKDQKFITGYLILALLITGFLDPHYYLGPVLMYPFVNLLISIGFIWLISRLLKKHEVQTN